MRFFDRFARRQEPPAPSEEEQRQRRQQNARTFYDRIQQEPDTAPAPTDLPTISAAAPVLRPPVPPPMPATLDVARELERARENGLFNNVVRAIRHEADSETLVSKEIQRKLDARREIFDRSEQMVQAENKLKDALYERQIRDEKKSAELTRAQMERLKAERELLAKLHAPAAPEPSEPAALPSVRITDAQVEAMALRIVMQLKMESDPAHAWETQRAELYKTLPVNIAREVEGKVLEKRSAVA